MDVRQPPPSGRPATDALVGDTVWDGLSLSFSFPTAGQYTGYSAGEEPFDNFEVFNPAQQAAVIAILGSIASFTNLTFTQNTGLDAGTAVLRFGMSDGTEVAHAYLPHSSEVGGDAWFRNTGGEFDNPVEGGYAWYTIVHEIGHALGLDHPHESVPPMSLDRDWMPFSAMSYRSYYGMDVDAPYPNGEWSFAPTYMIEDIAALQFLYGANFTHNSGNSTYTWSPTTGEMFINGVGQGAPGGNVVFMPVWDGGGTDTYDLSNTVLAGAPGITIDLRPGQWTVLPPAQTALLNFQDGGRAPGSIANPLLFNGDNRSLIENAIGSIGNDNIFGNDVANVLTGGGGADLLEGFNGNDTLYGDAGQDNLYGGSGDDTLFGGDDNDALFGGDGLNNLDGGAGNDALEGGNQVDQLTGGTGDDTITGLNGADTLFGGDGADRLDGGGGADVLHGGLGNDTYVLAPEFFETVDEVVELDGEGLDTVETTRSYSASQTSIENVFLTGTGNIDATGNASANRLVGNIGNNTLNGGTGADVMRGNGGNDTYYVDNVGDQVFENGNGGTDIIYSSVSFVLAERDPEFDPFAGATPRPLSDGDNEIESLVLNGVGNLSATGNQLANTLTGNSSNNVLNGMGGDDILIGGNGADQLIGGSGADVFRYTTAVQSPFWDRDWLSDFEHGIDKIDLTAINATYVALLVETDSSSTLVRIGANSTETMLFTVAGAATMADFLFTGTPEEAIAGSSGNDTLVGGVAVRMVGGAGNDVYHVSQGGEQVLEYGSEGFDTVYTSVSFVLAFEEVEALFASDSAATTAINLTGNYVNNVISGNAGANIIDGGNGSDTLTGGGGADQLIGGGQGDVFLYTAASDSLAGQEDWLSDFEHGSDKIDMRSLAVDTISFQVAADSSSTRVTLETAAGSLVINVAGVATIDDFLFTSIPAGDSVYGTSGPDTLDAGGRSGISLIGLTGNDNYLVFDGSEIIVENVGEGTDRVFASVSYTLTAGAEVELLTTANDALTTAIDLTGNELANAITGNAGVNVLTGGGGNDALNGGLGNDTLVGGTGNDVYYVDAAGDVVQEGAGAGTDTVYASVSYGLAAGAEVEVLRTLAPAATTALNLSGNAFANTIVGNAGANSLDGGNGNDMLIGGAGNDLLSGGSGIDTLAGGTGDDRYIVDNAGDVVVEGAGEGAADRVFASVSYILGAGVQVEQLTTSNDALTTALNLTGNELANAITGNAGANTLNGGGGNDVLNGGLGNDVYYVDAAGDLIVEGAGAGTDTLYTSVSYVLAAGAEVETLSTISLAATTAINLTGSNTAQTIYGNAGANLIDGRGGNDLLAGLGGNDVYYVDSAGDVISEAAGGGTDTLYTSVTYVLPIGSQVETLSTISLGATTAINLTGSAIANTIYGNAGANILDGRGGNDLMGGLAGNDVYYIDSAGDVVSEVAGNGTDTAYTGVSFALTAGADVEVLSAISLAATTAIDLTGSALGNTLYGNAGANVLDGRAGSDLLQGFGGADTYAFSAALGAGNIDTILGYAVADDTIQLDDAIFTGLALGGLSAAAFNTGAAASDADDRIVYNSATGALMFDPDGTGAAAAIQFATLSPGLALAAGEFVVV